MAPSVHGSNSESVKSLPDSLSFRLLDCRLSFWLDRFTSRKRRVYTHRTVGKHKGSIDCESKPTFWHLIDFASYRTHNNYKRRGASNLNLHDSRVFQSSNPG